MSASLARLWGVLEFLTGTARRTYDDTIRRVSFHFANRDVAKTVLEHLRQVRNGLVHEGREPHSAETCVYQAKQFAEALLEFHVRNRFRFDSLDDAGAFFDLPQNLDEVEKRIMRLKAVRKYQGL